MNTKNLLLLLLFPLCFWACGPQTEESNVEETTETETEEVSTNESTERASPLKNVSGTIGEVTVEMSYSSPAVKGRKVWGGLVPYDAVWRTGANEATTISFDKDVNIGGETLPAGKYGLFTIPTKEAWTVIFNKEWDQWGAYEYKEEQDALRVTVSPESAEASKERLEFAVNDQGVVFAWDDIALPIGISPM